RAIRAKAEERAAAHVALVRRRDEMRHRRRERLENGVDHGRQREAPASQRRGRPGAQYGALRQDHLERAETAFVHVKLGRAERLERDARRRNAARTAGIERTWHLRMHLAEVDR